MSYILSQQAEEDIITIFITGAKQFGITQAKRYHQQLTDTFEFLADNPHAAPLRTEITPAVHLHPVGSHLVIYQLNGDNSIFILRVRHSHEDWIRQT